MKTQKPLAAETPAAQEAAVQRKMDGASTSQPRAAFTITTRPPKRHSGKHRQIGRPSMRLDTDVALVQAQDKVEGLVRPTPIVLLLFYGTYQHNQWETDGGLGDEEAKIGWLHCPWTFPGFCEPNSTKFMFNEGMEVK